jgi:hypothetical protein
MLKCNSLNLLPTGVQFVPLLTSKTISGKSRRSEQREKEIVYLYLDESGDLGFKPEKKGSSKKFVITVLACFSDQARRNIRKAIQRTIKSKINKGKKKKHIQELKGSKTDFKIKKYFYEKIKGNGWEIFTLVLNKNRVHDDLKTKNGKKKLYNYLSRILIEKMAPSLQSSKQNIELFVDKSKNSEEIRDFNNYLENQLEALLPLNIFLKIFHLSSTESFELQAVDLFCWGIFRKYEQNNTEWYELFSNRIAFETEYLR